jgi:RNA polymerase sigma-70 factor (ECF subfamily)
MTRPSDNILMKMLKEGDQQVFDHLFTHYYNYMCHAVYRIIPDNAFVEDVVQEVFYEMWKKRDNIKIHTSLKAYLRRASVNKSLNHIRDRKINFNSLEEVEHKGSGWAMANQLMEAKELAEKIDLAIDQLPEKCRIIFAMSRFEEMSYREISEALNISIKTVENQISKALRHMRVALQPYVEQIF